MTCASIIRPLCFLLPSFIIMLSPATTGAESDSHWRDEPSCGRTCCYLMMKLQNLNVTHQQVVNSITLSPKGSSLQDLWSCCNRLGMNTEVIKATPADFDKLPLPAIAHLYHPESDAGGMGHYVVVIASDEHNIYLLDPTFPRIVASTARGNFFRSWSGYLLVKKSTNRNGAILLSVILCACLFLTLSFKGTARLFTRLYGRIRHGSLAPIAVLAVASMAGGCGRPDSGLRGHSENDRTSKSFELRVWSTEKHLGALPPKGEATAAFSIENTGSETVDLETGDPSCSCTSVALSPTRLRPGDRGTLKMGLRDKGTAGPVSGTVQVRAIGREWADTFKVTGVVTGPVFTEAEHYINDKDLTQLDVQGRLFFEKDDQESKVDVTPVDATSANFLSIANVSLSPPTTSKNGLYSYCDATVSFKPKGISTISGRRSLQYRVNYKEKSCKFSIIIREPATAKNLGIAKITPRGR
jgi:hypothetical protein